jgi:FkbM family methyltransferase
MRIENYGCAFEVTDNPKYANFWKSHFSRDWEVDTFEFLSRHLTPGKTLIDIGSWIGPIALPASQVVEQCICFEPDPVAYDEFVKNIELNNYTNIFLEKKAVSTHKSIWLGADELGESITSDIRGTNNRFEVECISVEEIFKKYNLTQDQVCAIKIDIEGHEAELLQDDFLINLNIPMHVSLHFEFAENKGMFLDKVSKFLKKKNIDTTTLNINRNIAIEVL